jgi:hypothetical protein
MDNKQKLQKRTLVDVYFEYLVLEFFSRFEIIVSKLLTLKRKQ